MLRLFAAAVVLTLSLAPATALAASFTFESQKNTRCDGDCPKKVNLYLEPDPYDDAAANSYIALVQGYAVSDISAKLYVHTRRGATITLYSSDPIALADGANELDLNAVLSEDELHGLLYTYRPLDPDNNDNRFRIRDDGVFDGLSLLDGTLRKDAFDVAVRLTVAAGPAAPEPSAALVFIVGLLVANAATRARR